MHFPLEFTVFTGEFPGPGKEAKKVLKKGLTTMPLSPYNRQRFLGQAVKTSPSHGENEGSIPSGTAKYKAQRSDRCAFSFCETAKNKPPALQGEGRSLDIRKSRVKIKVGLQTTN